MESYRIFRPEASKKWLLALLVSIGETLFLVLLFISIKHIIMLDYGFDFLFIIIFISVPSTVIAILYALGDWYSIKINKLELSIENPHENTQLSLSEIDSADVRRRSFFSDLLLSTDGGKVVIISWLFPVEEIKTLMEKFKEQE